MSTTSAMVTAVCMVHAVKPGHYHDTAIDKRPAPGSVRVDDMGLVGDEQCDRGHGGPDLAVYVYADEDAAYFSALLQRELPPGVFGENIRTVGLDVTGARLGERWRIGEVLLEVRQPRTPCPNLSLHVGVDRFHVEFHRSGRVGAMCRVLHGGEIAAGAPVAVQPALDHEVTVAGYSRGIDPAAAADLLAADLDVAAPVRAKAQRVLRRARRATTPAGDGS
jgi:MOSC domain-containing protein YiiM